jgi:hypothetical protein
MFCASVCTIERSDIICHTSSQLGFQHFPLIFVPSIACCHLSVRSMFVFAITNQWNTIQQNTVMCRISRNS